MNNELTTLPPEPPAALMRQATDVAGLCKEIVLKTACVIQGRKYVKAEGWMAIATAHGCIASSREVRKVEGGWTAIGEIRRISDGVLLSQAEGFVGTGEKRWGAADEYACRAMAQTRAISRACRAAFAHVVVMMDAGLSTTPAEEVPEGGFKDAPHAPPAPVSRVASPVPVQSPHQTLSALLEASKTKLLNQPRAVNTAMFRHFVMSGIIQDTEDLGDVPMAALFPSVDMKESAADNRARIKADFDKLMAAIQSNMDGDDQIPGVEVPTEGHGSPASAPEPPPGLPPGCQSKQITVKAKSVKPGLKKNGQPYTRHGVCSDADEWFNTFSDSIAARALEGQPCTVWFTTSTYGNDLQAVT